MRIVKLTTPWNHAFLKDQISSVIEDVVFEIDNDCRLCDYWVIWGDLPPGIDKQKVKCPRENVIYMVDEAFPEKQYDVNFLDQFNTIITCRQDIQHRNIIHTHEINTWHLKKTFSEVNNKDLIPKTKSLSVVCSDLTWLAGHKKRYAFVNRLIGHFKDRLDVYGRGFNPINDKWEALAPYKYSIAIENSAIPGYFTEKLSECFLAHTHPIYFGAPDIHRYFDKKALTIIDIDDYKSSIRIIEDLLEEDVSAAVDQQKLLIEQKLLYLSLYHLFPALANILNREFNSSAHKSFQTISSIQNFYKETILKKILRKINNFK